jgi:aryl-alcohol dehydrogenase-like predicted oxidoreductase
MMEKQSVFDDCLMIVWEFAMVASSEKRSKRKEKLNKRLLAIDNLESPQGQQIAQAALKYLLKNTEGKQFATSNTEIVPSTSSRLSACETGEKITLQLTRKFSKNLKDYKMKLLKQLKCLRGTKMNVGKRTSEKT